MLLIYKSLVVDIFNYTGPRPSSSGESESGKNISALHDHGEEIVAEAEQAQKTG